MTPRSIRHAEQVVQQIGLQYGDGGWYDAMSLALAGRSFDYIYRTLMGPDRTPFYASPEERL